MWKTTFEFDMLWHALQCHIINSHVITVFTVKRTKAVSCTNKFVLVSGFDIAVIRIYTS